MEALSLPVFDTDNALQPGTVVRQPPLTHRQTQVAVERLYDTLLTIEQLNRDAPPPDYEALRPAW